MTRLVPAVRQSARELATLPIKTKSARSTISSNVGATTVVAYPTVIHSHATAQATIATHLNRSVINQEPLVRTAGNAPLCPDDFRIENPKHPQRTQNCPYPSGRINTANRRPLRTERRSTKRLLTYVQAACSFHSGLAKLRFIDDILLVPNSF